MHSVKLQIITIQN